MFDTLSSKLQDTFKHLTGRGTLTEKNIEDAIEQVRVALLEADVNYEIVKDFVVEVRGECLGEKVMKSVTPGQQAIKIVNDHLAALMGESNAPLVLTDTISSIMMVGLHGSGKTTTTSKLATLLKKEGKRVLMVAADIYRPAAIDQLEALGNEIDVPVFANRSAKNVNLIVTEAMTAAKNDNRNVVIIDTAGRLQIDKELVSELIELKKHVSPNEILLVGDAALGQEAVSVAEHFNDALDLTGIILTKLDGDARGGAALSMREITGKPIKFIGVGEKSTDFEPFHPDRMASRILGMGDVVSLVEKAAETISEEEAKKLEQKMLKNRFDLNDFLKQLAQLKRLGGMTAILDLIPGGKKLKDSVNIDENMLKHIEAILQSMTPEERSKPELLNTNTRQRRIAGGSGRSLVEVQQLLNRFDTMKGMMSNYRKIAGSFGGESPLMEMPQFPTRTPNKSVSQKDKKAIRKKHKIKMRGKQKKKRK